jgi:hypothetical protein
MDGKVRMGEEIDGGVGCNQSRGMKTIERLVVEKSDTDDGQMTPGHSVEVICYGHSQ